jgi:CRISPR-associated protein Csh2
MSISKRREILFLYDVKNANPNGDPADENKPRIDEETGINLVTDVRLKRTIRDYLFSYEGYNGEGDKDIFVRQTECLNSKTKEIGNRISIAIIPFVGKTKEEIEKNVLSRCIDLRLFGGVIPLELKEKDEDKKEKKSSITFTGPVQFKMGHSLHKVQMMHIQGTGAFAGTAGAQQQTFRQEDILPYSLIAFYGIVNENAAKHTKMTDEDFELLKKAIWEGTRNLITRSKFEHCPRLLLTIEHNNPGTFIGELDKYILLETDLQEEKIRDISEVTIDFSQLYEKIKKLNCSYKIEKDERVKLKGIEIK